MAARATFALKAGLCARRARLAIVSPDMRHSRRSQADFPLIGLSEFAQPPLSVQLSRHSHFESCGVHGTFHSALTVPARCDSSPAGTCSGLQSPALATMCLRRGLTGVRMDFSITLVNLAGSVALLLWGVHMVQPGVQRALGARLRGLLGTALRNRFQAFLAGIGVTAILQSSTATGLMVTGFAAGGDAGGQCRHHADRAGAVLQRRRGRARPDPDR